MEIFNFTREEDNFMMDCENEILRTFWRKPFEELKGIKRIENTEWINLIIKYTEIDLKKYFEWVKQGNGDEWFIDEY